MRPTLIIDADDTLWENERYYEDCIEMLCELMAHSGFEPAAVVRTVAEVERERVPAAGYAPEEFARNLALAYERLCIAGDVAVDEVVRQRAYEAGRGVIDHPVEPFEGVVETLGWLSGRFRLILLTKGDRKTQERKLERSGLSHFFEAVHVVPEKDAEMLLAVVDDYGLDRRQTWMVGNSPRSDINPALEAGIGAVHIPHDRTWDLEQAPISEPHMVVELRTFAELVQWCSQMHLEA